MTITYEWDLESTEECSGDILDHSHADKLSGHKVEEIVTTGDVTTALVLVREIWHVCFGMQQREWAYAYVDLSTGLWILPTHFSDAMGIPGAAVPKKFRDELARWQGAAK